MEAVRTRYDAPTRRGTTTLASYAYTLDPVGNRTKVVEADGSATPWSFDDNARLLGAARFELPGTVIWEPTQLPMP